MSSDSKIHCQIRKELVAAQPEELVRQNLIHQMVHRLGYPPSGIVIEKGLRQMPHLTLTNQANIPQRRADIVVFATGIHPQHDLYPLLLIECKATKLTPKVINQVVGYNHYLQAYFVAIANQVEAQFASSGDYCFHPGLPAFADLKRKE